MEEISIKISGCPRFAVMIGETYLTVSMDESGVKATVVHEGDFPFDKFEKALYEQDCLINNSVGSEEIFGAIDIEVPKTVSRYFTVHAIDRILSLDEIPSKKGLAVLDGTSYTLVVKNGSIEKEYNADCIQMESMTLLKYLMRWYDQL